jgi:uncharacterized protein
MSILDTIKADQLAARKVKDSVTTALLTTLIGEIEGELTRLAPEARLKAVEATVTATVKSFLKKNGENNVIAGDRRDSDWCDQLAAEAAALSKYLPTQLSSAHIADIVATLCRDVGNRSKGVLMKFFKDNHAGQYDGKVAAGVVDTILLNQSGLM